MNSNASIKDVLLRTLYGGGAFSTSLVELKIINTYPLTVVDDFSYSVEIGSLTQEVYDEICRYPAGRRFKIRLIDWEFVVKPVEGTDDYYFDVVVKNYE